MTWLLFIVCALTVFSVASEAKNTVGAGIVAGVAVAGMVAAVLIQNGRL
ncbi:hypothetical protein Q0M94_28350 (plasmid) [Deinococcus radiomollis]